MGTYRIRGGNKIFGEYTVNGAKNAVLPVLAASILSNGECVLKNVPDIKDVSSMKKILKEVGGKITEQDNMLAIDTCEICDCFVSLERMKEMRSSVFLLGALLGRCGEAIISQPGGCDIGRRPIDLHLYALKKLGVDINEKEGFIICKADKLTGNEIDFSFPSVGATENAIMAAVLAEGTTIIHNGAKEPEIVELQNFLNKCGAKVQGAGTKKIVIEGVNELGGCEYTIMPDRIECGTYLVATAMTGGEIEVIGADSLHMKTILQKLIEIGCEVYVKRDKIYVKAKKDSLFSSCLKTGPYPAFPTDLQSPFLALLTVAKGKSVVEENIFENRFNVVNELCKMGAKIQISEGTAYIQGVENLTGGVVTAPDLRGGAALVCAGLSAEGCTIIHGTEHIERGYNDIVKTLRGLGADIINI